jgi:hypothetical protein
MQTIINFLKNLYNKIRALFFNAKTFDPVLAQALQDELFNVRSFIENLSRDVATTHPLLKTIILSKVDVHLFKTNEDKINQLKPAFKSLVQSCDQQIQECVASCNRHNEIFEKFVQVYIRNGLSLTGISTFDPQKMSAYKEVIEQHTQLMQSTKRVQDSCKQALSAIDQLNKAIE